ncbi:laccase [Salvia divinorum]|uniref:Laccase n=1 Tax=Salvia divinorum TaxID=28513 RepID=A0ABD1GJV1_SALDI
MNKLNPNARPFVPFYLRSDDRSLYMTFSNGTPLSNEEIGDFFTSIYGQCVEYVYVHGYHRKKDPKFGKIIFTSEEIARMVLRNQEVEKMEVNSKPVWLKKYIPRSQRREPYWNMY